LHLLFMNPTGKVFPRCTQGLYCFLTTPALLDIAWGPESDKHLGLILKTPPTKRGFSVNIPQAQLTLKAKPCNWLFHPNSSICPVKGYLCNRTTG